MSTFALIHSPVCGPETWHRTAAALAARGHQAWVPNLSDQDADPSPLWQQNADSIATAFAAQQATDPIIWVAHSGAVFRLPAYRTARRSDRATWMPVAALTQATSSRRMQAS